jgi:hypothetical protein
VTICRFTFLKNNGFEGKRGTGPRGQYAEEVVKEKVPL